MPNNCHKLCIRLFGHLMLLSAVLVLPGCSSEEVVQFEDYLEELEFERPLETDQEIKVSVNSYRIPFAARNHDAAGRELPPMWVQMKFELYVIAAAGDEKAILAGIERHRGMLDDTVITTCRRTSIDQLEDNRWDTIKSNLLDAIRPLLGDKRVRKITLNSSAAWEPI